MTPRHATARAAARECTSSHARRGRLEVAAWSPAGEQLGAQDEHTRAAVAKLASELFEAVSLEALGCESLMDRMDTKYLLPLHRVPEVLRRCASDYRVLEVDGRRMSQYRTVYYDTPDLAFYRAHHAGRTPRCKVRVRTYLDSGDCYLEVKLRTNKGRTLKTRVPLSGDPLPYLADDALRKLEGLRDLPGLGRVLGASGDLCEVVTAEYHRLTLVGRSTAERVTLDLMLAVSSGARSCSFPGLAIAEVKQEKRHHSPVLEALRGLPVRPGSVSKYCLGIMHLGENVKMNRFKDVLRRIRKTSGNALAPA